MILDKVDVISSARPSHKEHGGGMPTPEYRLSRKWRPGFRFDYHQLPSEPALITNPFTGLAGTTVNRVGNRTEAMTYSPYITFYPSEFQRFILPIQLF